MYRMDGRREGFALASAVVALVLVGVLVTGGFIAATQESRISESTYNATEALNIAEFGLNETVGTWQIEDYEEAASRPEETFLVCRDGTTVDITADPTLTCPNAAPVGEYTVSVTPLGGSGALFLVQSTGRLLRSIQFNAAEPPQRTVAMVVRTTDFNVDMDRAVTVYDKLTIQGNATVTGRDTIPKHWENCSPVAPGDEMQTGVVAKDPNQVTTKGNGKLFGEPPKRPDPSLDKDSFGTFGDLTYEDLVAAANWTFPGGINPKTHPSTTPGNYCNYDDEMNWGAPLENKNHPCKNYFPIIHVTGDLQLNSNAQGQGILLVDGDLHLGGGYEFFGIVIVQGALRGGNGGSKIWGTTYVKGDAEIGSELKGTPIVTLSSCAIEQAIKNNPAFSYAMPISSRSWFDFSAVGVEN